MHCVQKRVCVSVFIRAQWCSVSSEHAEPILRKQQHPAQCLNLNHHVLQTNGAEVCCGPLRQVPYGPSNPSTWESNIWGWLGVRRSAILHYTVNQHPHWACQQYGHSGGTQGWLGVKKWQLCLQDTSRSAKCHPRAAVGHCFIVCVQCCRMVDSVPIWHTISIL